MTMGHSGGRSAGHPQGEGAKRKNTPREREGIDPPWDEMVPRYRLTDRGIRVVNWTIIAIFCSMTFLAGFGLATWFGFR